MNLKQIFRVSALTAVLGVLAAAPAAAQLKADAVVKVFVSANRMDFLNPWQSHGGQELSGSGEVIEGNRILTNAHVVQNSTFIQVRKESDPKKYVAHVAAIGDDCDLAILQVDDPDFFRGVRPLVFGSLPDLRESVTAIGYPLGGDKLSITEGIVSRVEIINYVQSGRPLLGVQIDAAINPGNSGGPVLKDGRMVGVAMQGIAASQNIGYMIPVPVIEHFLKDLEDGHYDGIPLLGIAYENTENAAMRDYYKVPEDAGGVLVTHVAPFSSADGILKKDDVVLAVDGTPISADGTVPFRNNERLSLIYPITSKQTGARLKVDYLRKGKVKSAVITMKVPEDLVPVVNYYEKPSYYIYGGLVFTVLSTDLINEWILQNAVNRIPFSYLYWARGAGQLNTDRKKEVVVLSEVLPDAINVGYHNQQNVIVTKVNGQEFKSFKEFVGLVEKNTQTYVVFETENKQEIVLSRNDAARATADILARNSVPARFSKDVAEWIQKP